MNPSRKLSLIFALLSTGLGLSVSYGIVQDHGGWIAVDPTYQRGSIYLPGDGVSP